MADRITPHPAAFDFFSAAGPPSPIENRQALEPDEAAALRLSFFVNLRDLEKLGEGAQGQVWKCAQADDASSFVVRKEMVFMPGQREEYLARLEQAHQFEMLQHPHLIRYLAVVPDDAGDRLRLNIVMPFYVEKDLEVFIANQRAPISEYILSSMALQLSMALSFLHQQSPPIVHRDVCPRNILVFNEGKQVVLMDLDTARTAGMIGPAQSWVRTLQAASPSTTMEYSAPEAERGDCIDPKCDVFSLGVVLFMAASFAEVPLLPLNGELTVLNHHSWTAEALEEEVRIAIRNNCPEYSDHFIALVQRLLVHNKRERLSSTDAARSFAELMEALLENGAV